MFIKDLETGEIHKYGENCHDSLVLSEDGRMLTYYNLQNGGGSVGGGYIFCNEDGKTPKDAVNVNEWENRRYWNIGGAGFTK